MSLVFLWMPLPRGDHRVPQQQPMSVGQKQLMPFKKFRYQAGYEPHSHRRRQPSMDFVWPLAIGLWGQQDSIREDSRH